MKGYGKDQKTKSFSSIEIQQSIVNKLQNTQHQKQNKTQSKYFQQYRNEVPSPKDAEIHKFFSSLAANRIKCKKRGSCYQQQKCKISILQEFNTSQIIKMKVSLRMFQLEVKIFQSELDSPSHHHKHVSRGTFGTIYSAKLEDKDYAFKCIQFYRSTNQKQQSLLKQMKKVKDFIHEFCIAKILSVIEAGPLISSVFGFDMIIHQNCIEFAMELCQPSQNAKVQNEGIIKKLGNMHFLNIVHRDIKPQNILLSKQLNQLVFCDFGSSQSINEPIGQQSYLQPAGTFGYLTQQGYALLDRRIKIDAYYNDLFALKKSLNKLTNKQITSKSGSQSSSLFLNAKNGYLVNQKSEQFVNQKSGQLQLLIDIQQQDRNASIFNFQSNKPLQLRKQVHQFCLISNIKYSLCFQSALQINRYLSSKKVKRIIQNNKQILKQFIQKVAVRVNFDNLNHQNVMSIFQIEQWQHKIIPKYIQASGAQLCDCAKWLQNRQKLLHQEHISIQQKDGSDYNNMKIIAIPNKKFPKKLVSEFSNYVNYTQNLFGIKFGVELILKSYQAFVFLILQKKTDLYRIIGQKTQKSLLIIKHLAIIQCNCVCKSDDGKYNKPVNGVPQNHNYQHFMKNIDILQDKIPSKQISLEAYELNIWNLRVLPSIFQFNQVQLVQLFRKFTLQTCHRIIQKIKINKQQLVKKQTQDNLTRQKINELQKEIQKYNYYQSSIEVKASKQIADLTRQQIIKCKYLKEKDFAKGAQMNVILFLTNLVFQLNNLHLIDFKNIVCRFRNQNCSFSNQIFAAFRLQVLIQGAKALMNFEQVQKYIKEERNLINADQYFNRIRIETLFFLEINLSLKSRKQEFLSRVIENQILSVAEKIKILLNVAQALRAITVRQYPMQIKSYKVFIRAVDEFIISSNTIRLVKAMPLYTKQVVTANICLHLINYLALTPNIDEKYQADFKQKLNIFSEIGDNQKQLLFIFGRIQQQKRNYAKSIQYYQLFLSLGKRQFFKQQTFFSLGIQSRALHKYETQYKYFKQFFETIKLRGNHRFLIELKYCMSVLRCFHQQRDQKLIKQLFSEVSKSSRKLKSKQSFQNFLKLINFELKNTNQSQRLSLIYEIALLLDFQNEQQSDLCLVLYQFAVSLQMDGLLLQRIFSKMVLSLSLSSRLVKNRILATYFFVLAKHTTKSRKKNWLQKQSIKLKGSSISFKKYLSSNIARGKIKNINVWQKIEIKVDKKFKIPKY